MSTIDKATAREAAKVNAKGDLVHEFMSFAYYAYELSFTTETGVLVYPIEMPAGIVKISIVILENTTIKQIEKCWAEITKWKNALLEWQGASPNEANDFYESISKAQAEGISYNQIARRINQRIGELLTEYSMWLDNKEKYEKQFGEYNYHLWFHDYMERPGHNEPASFKFADDILSYCRPKLSKEQRHILLQDGLDRIKNEELPVFPHDEPVQGRRDIRERVNYWREKKKGVGNTS